MGLTDLLFLVVSSLRLPEVLCEEGHEGPLSRFFLGGIFDEELLLQLGDRFPCNASSWRAAEGGSSDVRAP